MNPCWQITQVKPLETNQDNWDSIHSPSSSFTQQFEPEQAHLTFLSRSIATSVMRAVLVLRRSSLSILPVPVKDIDGGDGALTRLAVSWSQCRNARATVPCAGTGRCNVGCGEQISFGRHTNMITCLFMWYISLIILTGVIRSLHTAMSRNLPVYLKGSWFVVAIRPASNSEHDASWSGQYSQCI